MRMTRQSRYYRYAKYFVTLLVVFVLGYVSINANQHLDFVDQVSLNNAQALKKEDTTKVVVDYTLTNDYQSNDYFRLYYPEQLEGVHQLSSLNIDQEKLASCMNAKEFIECTFTSSPKTSFKEYSGKLELEAKVVKDISNKVVFKNDEEKEYVIKTETDKKVLTKNENKNGKLEDEVKQNSKNETENNKLNRSSLSKTTKAYVAKNILDYPNHQDELFDAKDKDGNAVKTIFDDVVIKKNGSVIQDGDSININDKLAINYSFKIGDKFGNQINAGDYYEFKLPDDLKILSNSVTGNLVDKNDPTKIYGTYTVDNKGNAKIIFNENVAKESEIEGSLNFAISVDKNHITKPGELPIEIPFVDGDKNTTVVVKVDAKQMIDKEHTYADENEQIEDNKAKMSYKIRVNTLGFEMSDVVITDLLPKGVTYNGNLKVLQYKVKEDRSGYDDSVTPVDVTTGCDFNKTTDGFTIKLPDVGKEEYKAYEISFDKEVDFDLIDLKAPSWAKPIQTTITNKATLTTNEYDKVSASDDKTYVANHKLKKVALEDEYKDIKPSDKNDHHLGVVPWKITFTKDGIDLPGGTCKSGNNTYPCTQFSDVMVNLDGFSNEKGEKLSGQELNDYITKQFQKTNPGKKIEIVDNGNGKYSFVFPQGISSSFELKFYTRLKEETKVSNKITWNNNTSGQDFESPHHRKGDKWIVRDSTSDKNVIISDDGYITWNIEINREFSKLDKWSIIDKMVNTTLPTDASGKLEAGAITVYEYKENAQWNAILVKDTDYAISKDADNKGFEIQYNKTSSNKFRIVVKSKIAQEDLTKEGFVIRNNFEYHYVAKGHDYKDDGYDEFELNKKPQQAFEGSKSGQYEYDSSNGEDKIKWKVTINDNKIQIGENAVFYDILKKGQLLDTSFEPELYDENNQRVDLKNTGKLNEGPAWHHVEPGKNNYYGPYLNISGGDANPAGTLVVGFIPQTKQTYTLYFKTIVTTPEDEDNLTETLHNTFKFRDDLNKTLEQSGHATFTRNSKIIKKTHQVDPNDSSKIYYTISVNKEEKTINNVVITDSKWQNINPLKSSVVVVGSKTGTYDPKDYSLERTQTQMILKFAKIEEQLTITYTGYLDSDVDPGQSTTIVNVANITGDELQGGTNDSYDGFEVEVPEHSGVAKGKTGGFMIIKQDGFSQEVLENAKFDLYQVDAQIDGDSFIANRDGNNNLSLDSTLPVASRGITTNEHGKAVVHGLKYGVYILVETQAPTNYVSAGFGNDTFVDSTDNNKVKTGQIVIVKKEQSKTEIENSEPIVIDNIEKTEKKVIKVWEDQDNQDGYRTNDIYVNLYADDDSIEEKVKLKDDGTNLSYLWENLPKYKKTTNGTYALIDYTVEEVDTPDGYTPSVTDTYNQQQAENTLYLVNTHVVEKIDIKGLKTWEDANNKYNTRPDQVKVTLYKNGEPIDERILTEGNYGYEFNGLDKYYNHGQEVKYEVREELVKGYEPTYDENYNIINKLVKIDKTVIKNWLDDDNSKGFRPDYAKVTLYQNGTLVSQEPVVLNEGNGFSHTWFDLDFADAEGKEYEYTVLEVEIHPNYVPEYAVDEQFNLIVNNTAFYYQVDPPPPPTQPQDPNTPDPNTSTSKKVERTVVKKWQDNDDENGKRPHQVKVQLYVNNKKYQKPVVLNENNDWKYTFANLESGKNYTVKEVSTSKWYKASYSSSGTQLIITNKILNTPQNPKKVLPKTGSFNILMVSILLAVAIIISLKIYRNE